MTYKMARTSISSLTLYCVWFTAISFIFPRAVPVIWFYWRTSFTLRFANQRLSHSNPLWEADKSCDPGSLRVQALYSKATSEIFLGREEEGRGCLCCHGNHSMALSPGIVDVTVSVAARVVGYRRQMTCACFELLSNFFRPEARCILSELWC